LKNWIWVTKGTKERGKLKAEGSKELNAECSKLKGERTWRRAKVFGEIIFKNPDGRGSIWKRMRRRKDIRMADGR